MRSSFFRARQLVFLILILVGWSGAAGRAVEVYFSALNPWDKLIQQPKDWEFVRTHADGFYINFIQMTHAKPEQISATAALFTKKNAYLESDMHSNLKGGTPEETDARFIDMLQAGGFSIPYTSLNYGWSQARADLLATHSLNGKPRRLNFVQLGPWGIRGDITKDAPMHRGVAIADYRTWIQQSDGVSTDGPMGFWQNNQGQMREASLSVITYAHSLNKKAIIMMASYGANVKTYNFGIFLQTCQEEVRYFEDHKVLPDIWAVFEYATNTPSLPEQVDGRPANTTSGVAFWLINHLHDPQHFAKLDADGAPGADASNAGWTQSFTLRNGSRWLELAPALRLRVTDPAARSVVKLSLDGRDVTAGATSPNGIMFVGNERLVPGAAHHLTVQVVPRAASPYPPVLALKAAFSTHAPQAELILAPNVAAPDETDRRVVIPLP